MVSFAILALMLSTQIQIVESRGYWETYTHTKTIKWGEGLYHRHTHEGALTGYAYVHSSTGSYSFQDEWDAPTLHVWITNTDTEDIIVTFKCKFYVN
ncbi:MAG: hypothetical protein ACXAC2_10575 [Candidatus Kariarchaeaceae archaeon]